MSWCPNACDMIPMFTPDFFNTVANEFPSLATFNINGDSQFARIFPPATNHRN